MGSARTTIKTVFIAILYIIIIIIKIAGLYLSIRVRLWSKRFKYKWRFKRMLKKHDIPGDLRRELEDAYYTKLHSSLKIPGLLPGLRMLRRGWRLSKGA
ncbi:MAG: hypothetical protein GSR85_01790 [Desulfurococcales archaeon]|nr:hypothetical protein [Desulfurococcales archaeon]